MWFVAYGRAFADSRCETIRVGEATETASDERVLMVCCKSEEFATQIYKIAGRPNLAKVMFI